MKVLSVKQPWAYLICSGIKNIENRTWKLPEKYKGERVLIHAGLDNLLSKVRYGETIPFMTDEQISTVLSMGKSTEVFGSLLPVGAIIGSVEIVRSQVDHHSIWAEYNRGWPSDPKVIYHWVLANPILFEKPILNVKGKLGFWDY